MTWTDDKGTHLGLGWVRVWGGGDAGEWRRQAEKDHDFPVALKESVRVYVRTRVE